MTAASDLTLVVTMGCLQWAAACLIDTLLRLVGQVEELAMIRTLDHERREVESLQWADDLAPRQREPPEAALV